MRKLYLNSPRGEKKKKFKEKQRIFIWRKHQKSFYTENEEESTNLYKQSDQERSKV